MDIFQKIEQNKGPLGQHADLFDGYFTFPKLEGEIASRMVFRGQEKLVWSLNNYLGLANHPEVRKADADAAQDWGLAYPMGARMMSGHTEVHERLEKELAHFVKREDAFLVNYGYQGMVSIIDALVNRHDIIVYDSESHACIIDGVRLHQGKRYMYQHNNIENLEKQLKRAQNVLNPDIGGILVITEGVFGMSGDQGKLKEVVELKKKYDFRILLDDAHGFGALGSTGAGTDEEQDVQAEIDIYFSTFAKSMASIGAFVASTESVIQFLKYNTRSQIFAKSLPMPITVGNLKRLELLRERKELRDKLWTIVNALQNGLVARGFNIGKTNSPVTPVFLSGSTAEAGNLIIDLRENFDIFCSVVIYPVVPKGVIMIRLIPTAAHSLDDVEETLNAFSAVAVKLQNKEYEQTSLATA